MTDPIGPTMAGGIQTMTAQGYSVSFYPDANNYDLIKEGKNPVFYWVPSQLTIARRDGETGDFKFSLLRFVGGVASDKEKKEASKESVGGLLSLTTTGKIPTAAMTEAQQKVVEATKGHSHGLWDHKGIAPFFTPVLLMSNTTSISNTTLTEEGYKYYEKEKSGALKLRASGYLGKKNRSKMVKGTPQRDGDIGNWYWVLQGAGAGSIDPSAEHAFSAMVGSYPAQILHQGFKGTTTSPIFASSVMELQMWTPKVKLEISGEWKSIYKHFSGHANVHGLWASADIKLRFDELRKSGAIEVKITPVGSFPGSDKIETYLREKSDLLLDKFMQEAQRVIFEPAPVKESAAEASSSGSGASAWGFSLALKGGYEETTLVLSYREEMQFSHFQKHVISSSLDGMLQEMATGGAEAEKKYFPIVYLDDWPKKLARVCIPIAAWSTGVYNSLSVQIGYPNVKGELLWDSHVFTRPAPNETLEHWVYRTVQKSKDDVVNPPVGWEPDRSFVKRVIHFEEPDPNNQFVITQLDSGQSELRIDPGENGTPLNQDIEVRAESNKLMSITVRFMGRLTDDQFAELTVEPVDKADQPVGRDPVTFLCEPANIRTVRRWVVCPAPATGKRYRYKIKVTDVEEGSEWETAYKFTNTASLSAVIPKKNAQGVTFRFKDRK
ncbi:hypothetical protein ACPCTO_07455 [Streptomyces olivoreticuli]